MKTKAAWVLVAAAAAGACHRAPVETAARASGYIEATDVRVAPQVGGQVLEMRVAEGDRVAQGQVLARLDTADRQLTLRRAEADRDQAAAQLALLRAGARPEDVRQAAAQAQSAAADVTAARAQFDAADADLRRFEALLRANAGSRKQRDDAATRRDVAQAALRAAEQRARAAADALARQRAGARPQELAAARARVAAAGAQIASLQKNIADAIVKSPVGGMVTSKLVDAGELVQPGTPLVVVTDLDHAWANVYVDEPVVPKLRIGQPAVIVTDAGQRLSGTITFISPKAEFTPRNVQTADERSKLVYRIKIGADNRAGILKPGMPVEADLQVTP
ncbi:MAG TPA: HlyD family efflux transporter periplasmic adaptor subunit [Vicinamibacterales bacterium]|nr:HlyD family efflux transporter periplasmic adaptor subunit [Vicinamibacterales bacterium]